MHSPDLNRRVSRVFTGSGLLRALSLAALYLAAASSCSQDEVASGLLSVTPDSLTVSVSLSTTTAQLMTIHTQNLGRGELRWVARVKDASPWLSLQPDSGVVGVDSILVAAHPGGLALGVYRDTVVVSATTTAELVQVPVAVHIVPCVSVTPIADGASIADTLTTADCVAPHRAGHTARLFSVAGIAGDTISILLAAQFHGYLAFDTSLTPSAPPLAVADNCLGDSTNPCLYYVRLPRTTNYYVEVTGAGVADTGQFRLRLLHPGRAPNAPDSLGLRLVDSTTVINAGDTVRSGSILVRAVVSDSDLVDSLHLEAEVEPMGTPFTSVPNSAGPQAGNGKPAWMRVANLLDQTSYHVQVRAVDQTGRASLWGPGVTFLVRLTPPAPPILTFASQPSSGSAGTNPPVQVVARDSLGGVVTSFNQAVTLTITPDTGLLMGSETVSAVAGVATFSNFVIDRAGCHRLIASSAGLQPDTSATFCITPGPATALAFAVQPTSSNFTCSMTGVVMGPVVVLVVDAFGNTVPSATDQIQIALGTNPGGATLTGTTTESAVAGVATFSDLGFNKVGNGYTLVASAAGLTEATSAPFTVLLDACNYMLVFAVQPSNTAAGAVIAPPPQTCVKDFAGNPVPSFPGNVTIAIGSNPVGGTLTGTLTRALVNGCATFSDLSIDTAGSGYTLEASVAGIAGASSTAFNIGP